MSEKQNNDNNIISHLSRYWAIYLFVIQLIVTFTFGWARIDTVEGKVSDLQKTQDIQATLIDQQRQDSSEIKARLASIDTSLIFIKSALNINR